jgi:5-methylthioadenosine/S-adenosylhomocysteine deaminase
MVLTALFAKVAARDPTVFSAWEVLRMATIEGARAIGLGDEVGSLEPGKQADLIGGDLTELNLSPVLEAPVRVPGPRACPTWSTPGAGTK